MAHKGSERLKHSSQGQEGHPKPSNMKSGSRSELPSGPAKWSGPHEGQVERRISTSAYHQEPS